MPPDFGKAPAVLHDIGTTRPFFFVIVVNFNTTKATILLLGKGYLYIP